MKSLKGIGLGILMALGMLTQATPASALLTVDGISFSTGAVFKATRIFEDTISNKGDVLAGIGNVLSIEDNTLSTVWNTLDNGRELTFEFGGYVVEEIVVNAAGTIAEIFFSGGFANFYSDSTPDFSASAAGGAAADVANATNGNFWLDLIGAGTGVVCGSGAAGDPAAGACHNGDGTVITLQSTIFITGGNLSVISNGFGAGFLDVGFGGGLADSHFDTDSQPSGQDVNLTSNFSSTPGSVATNWDLDGTADLDLVAVPEPGTLALFGLGLLGLAGFTASRRRRNSHA